MKFSALILLAKALSILFLCSMLTFLFSAPVQAATTEALNCSANYQIVQTFANRAKWEMCWEPKAGYGYRLSQVIFTPPDGVRRKIMGAMHAAQLFVPYDDNGARYHDISYGINMAVLNAAECPDGVLLTNSTLCLINKQAGYAYKNMGTGGSGQSASFEIFGYYGVGNYYYTFKYTFFDDGSIEPSVLASGSLQRYGGSQLTGWPVGNSIAVNHSHLIIWRLDFDLDGPANNLVEQVEFTGTGTDNRNVTITPLLKEAKATNSLNTMRFWRVRNTAQNNKDGRNISYEIEPSVTDQLRASEDFTQNDFYLTQNRVGEDLVDSGLTSFVNGETVTDAVLWYGVNFHHVPRGEDDVKMPAHAQGFRIRPRDMTVPGTAVPNSPPVLRNPGAQTSPVNSAVNLPIIASDTDTADVLTFSASGLPAGLSINSATGVISGTISGAPLAYTVNIIVSDGRAGGTASASFTWNITGTGGQQNFSSLAPVTIRDAASAQPYPVNVNVSGLTGAISKVTVSLNGLSHTFPGDLDVLLVGPTGQKVMLLSDAGGGTDVNNVTLTFDSASTVAAPQTAALNSGVYKPTNYDASDVLPAPAPTGPYPVDLGLFKGTSPNGRWSVYVFDDAAADIGQIASGITLSITTSSAADTAPPTVVARSPAAGSAGVAFGTTISAQFSEAMTASTISAATFTLTGPNGAVPATLAYNASSFTATLTPQSALLGSSTYTATVKSGTGGVKDMAGNALQTDVSWSFTTQNAAGTQTFTAPGTITIGDVTSALPYPLTLNVSGMTGTVSKIRLTLNGLTHTCSRDLDILLVGPGGQKSILMSDAGGCLPVNAATVSFDATAAAPVSEGDSPIISGVYQPANYIQSDLDNFPAPAPAGPHATDLALFNGTSPNGAWMLYVMDDAGGDTGQIANGIALTITTQ